MAVSGAGINRNYRLPGRRPAGKWDHRPMDH